MLQFAINALQAEELISVLRDHVDGGEVLFTPSRNGSLVVAFNMATITIDANGQSEEN